MPSLLLGPLLRHVGRETATVWVETDGPCTVEVLGHRDRTFTVAGHHYGLVRVVGLAPGSVTPYRVHLDGEQVWPEPGSARPPSLIRTVDPDRGVRITFGSCRYASRQSLPPSRRYGVDALDAYARRAEAGPEEARPDLLLMLGDQVYADETTPATRERIRARRGLARPPHGQVADFEEYTWLYHESWSDPDVRWLFSTVPTAMIFDDHDVHDDWNTSRAWREQVGRTPWWSERIVGGLMSYWVYQHLGNLSPDELDEDVTWARVRAVRDAGGDAEPVLRELARAADAEADGAKGARWSFWRDLGCTRLVVLDSRCGRLLDGTRSMMGRAELDWVTDRVRGDYDHLLVGTSLPWLLAPALHHVEAWDERLCDHPHPRVAAFGEKLRQAADLEHWAAFRSSFEELSDLLGRVSRGELGSSPPATISVLSGDVHHSYVCEVDDPEGESRIYQVTCSPVHNHVPPAMRLAFRLAWSRAADSLVHRLLAAFARVPRQRLSWHRVGGPVFGNALGTLSLDGRRARLVIERAVSEVADGDHLEEEVVHDLTSDRAPARR